MMLRLSRVGGNPAGLINMPFGFVLAAQGDFSFDWIPVCTGMTF
jgi:hypothetical protein